MVSRAPLDRAETIVAPSVGSSLKRKRSDEPDCPPDFLPPSNQAALPQSPKSPQSPQCPQAKRPRVTFDPQVDIHILADWNEKSAELVGEEVRRALERHATGDNTGCDQIKHLLAIKPTSSEAPLTGLLQKYVTALTHNVASLTPKCSGLVHAIIDCHWVARNERFVQAYRKLMQSLIAVQPGYTASVLQMLVNMFAELPNPNMRQQDDPVVERVRMQARIHDCLKGLLRQDPMLPTHLSPVLPATFPFSSDTTKVHVQYIKNILRVAEYCPDLKGEITALIMDRLVKIDVQIQVDMDELDDDLEDDFLQPKQAEEENDDGAESSDDDSDSSEESISEEERRLKDLRENVAKLDTIMDLLFEYYDSIFAIGDTLETDDTFESLLSQFANLVLPTYRSRHTQFLLFHFSQYSPDLIERFAGCCSHLAFDNRRPLVLRVSAAAYLASFIARGAHVSRQVVRSVFDLLCHHLEIIRLSKESKCTGPDLRRYGPYYALCQALLYTFCFRWRDLIVTQDDEPVDDELIYQGHEFVWYNEIKQIMQRNFLSPLNPLKICSPEIVAQFARVAKHLHFLYVYNIIDKNKRIRLSKSLGGAYMDGVQARETALTMKKGEDTFLLDAYFPFDPYVLPKSKRWLSDDYMEWKPVPGLDPAVGENDDDEDDDEEDDEEEEQAESDSESNEVVEPVVDDDVEGEGSEGETDTSP